ncbi:hypothetical protein MARPO_0058s0054 [Marchantia polymorpha]|uniref:Thioredoxin domain-containing protein n=1 Tax=Marchantia polymorpha TaxID=3197 RepID=A0A2R6WTS2_MARPO|nr:hypothetical protein MARPO_0058s0054 [Marchantia polymorpha]|eukprot:PTQ37266.1 hypothetical protein MARPO_0058s0054 [Marchantia polymorpha]
MAIIHHMSLVGQFIAGLVKESAGEHAVIIWGPMLWANSRAERSDISRDVGRSRIFPLLCSTCSVKKDRILDDLDLDSGRWLSTSRVEEPTIESPRIVQLRPRVVHLRRRRMAALADLQGFVASSIAPSSVACTRGSGRVLKSAGVDSVCVIGRNVQSSVDSRCAAVAGNGGRIGLQGLDSKVGLRFWSTEQQLGIRDDTQAHHGVRRRALAPQADWEAGAEPKKKTWIPLELIASEAEFDRILGEARERNEAVVIDWMAAWCRKCLYLKPKLEKLAASYHPSIRFYYVDVNNVPQALVKRAAVTDMPTIQIWRDGAHQAQVIGGQQAAIVIDQVRDMITKITVPE